MAADDQRSTFRDRSRGWGVVRLAAVYAFLLALLIVARPSPRSLALGSAVAAAGLMVRGWAAGHLRKSVELVTSGPYAYVRHPLYLGRLLVFSGLCLAATLPLRANLALLLAGYGVFFAYYLPRKERVEPARLRRIHGAAYDRYHAAVPALFPRRTRFAGAGSRRWSAARMLRNREHWMIAGVSAFALALAWKALR